MDKTPAVKRRLTAILAADAVGYSARMAENEERAVRTLQGHRRIIDNLIADHGGRIVGTAGDSVLAEFGSSVEAVRCAVEIQAALATRNDSLPDAERLHFRIGINLGDVIVDGDDILGDGVNVASRLEGIAEPGGILVSSSVYDQITGKLNLGFEDVGERSLKNIGRPVRAYRVAPAGSPQRHPPRSRSRAVPVAVGAGLVAVAALAVFVLARGGDNDAPRSTTPSSAPAQSQPQPLTPPPPTQSAGNTPAPPAATPADPVPPTSAVPPPATQPQPPPTAPQKASYSGGFAQARCQRRDGQPGPVMRGPVQVSDGEIAITLGQPGEPGYITLRGTPDVNGSLVLEGYIIPLAGRGRGGRIPARYEGRLVNGRGMLTGSQGIQRCSVGLQLK